VWRPLARRNVSAAALLTLFSIHTNCLFVPASLVTRTRVIAALPAWKLTNEANWIRFERKYHNGK
jgi:hypothetical protein